MGPDSTGYKIVFVLHLMAVIVGFGTHMLNGLYDAQSKKREGRERLAVTESTFAVGKVAEYAIYAVPVLGFALTGMSDGAWEFSQTWIWLSTLLYIVGIGISHGLMRPTGKRKIALETQLAGVGGGSRPPEVAQVEALDKKLAVGGMTLNLLVLVIVALMVFKPGV